MPPLFTARGWPLHLRQILVQQDLHCIGLQNIAAALEAARLAAERLKKEGRPEAAQRWLERLAVDRGGRAEGDRAEGQARVEVSEPGELFWTTELSLPREETAGETAPPRTQRAGETAAPLEVDTSLPVVAGEQVYVQTAGRLWAVGLSSGRVEWTVWPGDAEEHEEVQADCGRGGFSPVLAEGRVFANI